MSMTVLLVLVFAVVAGSVILLGLRFARRSREGSAGLETQRVLRRSKLKFRAKLAWHGWPTGAQPARGVNFHRSGALVLAPYPAPVGTRVLVHFETLNMAGSAYVRHCTRRGSDYSIGLEFQGSLVREHMAGWELQLVPSRMNDGMIS
jgi:hypothetical protein